MKMKATIEVEFEANSTRALEAALARGVDELRDAIQYGKGGEPTAIRSNTTKIRVDRQQITQVHEKDDEKIPMAKKLRDQLIGSWKLVSYVEEPLDGSAPNHPMGERPMGVITYTPEGYMSAQLMRPNRTPFVSADWYRATPEEYGRQASTYFAYAGPFQVDEEKKTVAHSVFVSLFPNWIGQAQLRAAKVEDDTLHLSTTAPLQSGGKLVNAHLKWQRA